MGICCGKGVMPIVDDTGRPRRHVEPAVSVPTVEFDVVVPERGANLTLSFTRSGCAAAMDQSIHTVSDCSVSLPDGRSQSLSATMRDDLSRSFVTNGLNDVLAGHVDQFVHDVLQMSVNEPRNILEESVNAVSASSRSRARTSLSTTLRSSDQFTKEQKQYFESAPCPADRISRLIELEQLCRQEIFGAWKINTTLFQMALMRIMPTIRRYRVAPRQQQQKNNREVLVIHAKDIDLQVEDGAATPEESPMRQRESSSTALFSPQEEVASSSPVAEHYQMLALTAREVSLTANVQARVVNNTWDFLSLPGAADHLNAGNVFFRFVCSPIPNVDRDTIDMIATFINLTSFADEEQENNVPRIDIYSAEEQSAYVGILVKAMYLLPGVRMSHITTDLVASLDYQRNCQPGENKFENPDTPYTFRTVKSVIKFIFSVTIQMKVSEITDPGVLSTFKDVDGMLPAKVLLLERTKKNIHKTDSTVKVRSVLLYYPVNDGVLVNNQTIVLNTSLPRVVSKLMQTFGSQGATEAAQTAKQTRQYLIHRFGDSRT
ncbi:aspartate aminotransferase [Trypanosoma grayi]|uniref:aspartate aminotransferase n=1 Tax=Trypanosoma grayi TaxID=71804 RepID=UPI0004F436CE|nr:aspartate aminotransferase [Trypanosoma grayi]KEG11791.1 aspartate aminotransferase [Trypanosoma grayi]